MDDRKERVSALQEAGATLINTQKRLELTSNPLKYSKHLKMPMNKVSVSGSTHPLISPSWYCHRFHGIASKALRVTWTRVTS